MSVLRHNYRTISDICRKRAISFTAVTKCVCSCTEIVETAIQNGADSIADSRPEKLAALAIDVPRMCIRISAPQEAEDVVHACEISLQSEKETILALARAANAQGKRHKVVLMIDLGDLREGVYFENERELRALAECILANDSLEFYGVGTNLSCYGSILPDRKNLGELVKIAHELRRFYGIELPLVSGGATSTLPMVLDGTLPEGINNLRIGEAALFGFNAAKNAFFPELGSGAFVLESPIIERKTKPSLPVGTQSLNAFGEKVEFVDSGDMLRGICAFGRQTVDPSSIWPVDERLAILGASSDHALLNLDRASEYAVGDTVSFRLGYGSVLRLSSDDLRRFVYLGE